MKHVLSKTFTSGLYTHGSWGSRNIEGQHESTMDLYMHELAAVGSIEWDIPALDMQEEIGLWFSVDLGGVRTLIDYDGIMSLPKEAVELMREFGIVVTEDMED